MKMNFEIPFGWKAPQLDNLALPEKGSIRIGPFGSALKKHEYSGSGIGVLGIEHVHPNELVWENPKFIPESKYKDLTQYTVFPGDVLVTNMGTVGRACYVPDSFIPAIISSHLIKVSLDRQKCDPKYLCYALNCADVVVAQIKAKCQGAIMAGFNSSLLKSLLIPLPSLSEQQRIAAILDKADTIRRKRQVALQLTEELLRAAFLELFGDPVTNPKGWPMVGFSDLLAMPLRNGISPSTGGKYIGRVLTLSAITAQAFDPSATKIANFANEFSANDLVDKQDFLICRGNGNLNLVGRGKYSNSSMPDVVFPDTMIAARVKENQIEPTYLEAIWHNRMVRAQIESSARTTNGTYKINQTMVESVTLPLPPKTIQEHFAQVRAKVERLRQSFAAQDAENLFHSLVQRAFRGEL